MASRNDVVAYRKERIRKFMEMEEEDDDELFFVIIPAILQGLNDEKRPIHDSEYTGAKRMKEILEGHESRCKSDFRMEPEIFKATANYLRREGLLRDTRGVSVEEQLGMFMFMLSHNASNDRLQKTFQHSGETIHRHIKAVFDIVPTLTFKFLKLPNSNETHPKIASDPRFWPFFKHRTVEPPPQPAQQRTTDPSLQQRTAEPPPQPTQGASDVALNQFFANQSGQGASSSYINLDEEEHATSACSGRKEDDPGKKRKQGHVAVVLEKYVDFKMQQSKKFVEELDETKKPKEEYSIKNCMDVLDTIEELSDEEKAMATNVFKCGVNREIFMNFKKPTVRLIWLKAEIAPKA
ncbi:hypothetical protein ACP70R_049719 [Stipagrostis hirtigluma subsp. patula]